MRVQDPIGFNLIFDPISKSALIHCGDKVTWLAGPFATYRDALAAATRAMAGTLPNR